MSEICETIEDIEVAKLQVALAYTCMNVYRMNLRAKGIDVNMNNAVMKLTNRIKDKVGKVRTKVKLLKSNKETSFFFCLQAFLISTQFNFSQFTFSGTLMPYFS